MPDWLLANWEVIVLGVLGVVVAFWPQFKPFADAIKKAMKPDGNTPDGEDDTGFVSLVKAIKALIDHFDAEGDVEGGKHARESYKALVGECPSKKKAE